MPILREDIKTKMTYIDHFALNFGVAFRCFWMCFFHLAHAFIPCKYTSHEFWIGKHYLYT